MCHQAPTRQIAHGYDHPSQSCQTWWQARAVGHLEQGPVGQAPRTCPECHCSEIHGGHVVNHLAQGRVTGCEDPQDERLVHQWALRTAALNERITVPT